MQSAATTPWFSISPFAIAKDKIKYLGIYIGKTPASIYSLNYPPIFDKILKDMEMWRDLPFLSQVEHINRLTKALRKFLWQSMAVYMSLNSPTQTVAS